MRLAVTDAVALNNLTGCNCKLCYIKTSSDIDTQEKDILSLDCSLSVHDLLEPRDLTVELHAEFSCNTTCISGIPPAPAFQLGRN